MIQRDGEKMLKKSSNPVRLLQSKLEILIFCLRCWSEAARREKCAYLFHTNFSVPCGVWNRLYADEHLSRLHQRTIVLPMGFLHFAFRLCAIVRFVYLFSSLIFLLYFVRMNKSHGGFHRSVDGGGRTRKWTADERKFRDAASVGRQNGAPVVLAEPRRYGKAACIARAQKRAREKCKRGPDGKVSECRRRRTRMP